MPLNTSTDNGGAPQWKEKMKKKRERKKEANGWIHGLIMAAYSISLAQLNGREGSSLSLSIYVYRYIYILMHYSYMYMPNR